VDDGFPSEDVHGLHGGKLPISSRDIDALPRAANIRCRLTGPVRLTIKALPDLDAFPNAIAAVPVGGRVFEGYSHKHR
jgi:hypothetical protein